MTGHLTRGLVIGAKEIADPVVRKPRPRTDPSRADLVPDQTLREIEATHVTGIAVFGDAHGVSRRLRTAGPGPWPAAGCEAGWALGVPLPEMHADAHAHGGLARLAVDLATAHVGIEPRQDLLADRCDILVQHLPLAHGKVGILGGVGEPPRGGPLRKHIVLERREHVGQDPERLEVVGAAHAPYEHGTRAWHVAPAIEPDGASPRTARTISFGVAPHRARILTKRPMASKESPETVDGRGTGVRPNRSWLSRRAVRAGLILGLAYAAVRRPRAAAHSPGRERP